MTLPHRVTTGYVARHIPPESRIGTDVALLDIAQDFALTHLHRNGLFDLAVFKGGTALRKLYAGGAGRFSTDIDLALADPAGDRDTVADLAAGLLDGIELGPFNFSAEQRRGRWMIAVRSEFGDVPMPLKLDVGPPCWLKPEVRPFVATPIQTRYDFELPGLPAMRLEENLAEKVARLNRMAAARDASDLVWVATTPPHSGSDRALIRKLATLKVWVDVNGLDGHWRRTDGAAPLDVGSWMRTGRTWDDESIGLLAHPPPPIAQLEADLVRLWAHLGELDDSEVQLGRALEGDRAAVVAAITALPGAALTPEVLWAR